jgi:hypothetical protein
VISNLVGNEKFTLWWAAVLTFRGGVESGQRESVVRMQRSNSEQIKESHCNNGKVRKVAAGTLQSYIF